MLIRCFISSLIALNLYGASQDTLKDISSTIKETKSNFKTHQETTEKNVIVKVDTVVDLKNYHNHNNKMEEYEYKHNKTSK